MTNDHVMCGWTRNQMRLETLKYDASGQPEAILPSTPE